MTHRPHVSNANSKSWKIRLPEKMLRQVKRMAIDERRTMTQVFIMLVEEALQQREIANVQSGS